MEVAEAIRRRRMVRRFHPDRPVPEEDLDALVEAMLRAPSAGHTQAVRLLIWVDPDQRASFWREASPAATAEDSTWLAGLRTAPVLMSVWVSAEDYFDRYAEADKGWADRDPDRWSAPYWYVDAGMAVYAGLLMAVDRGLGACFFGIPAPRQDAVRSRFGVPPDQLSVGVLAAGYPAGTGVSGSAARRPRRPTAERVFRGVWRAP